MARIAIILPNLGLGGTERVMVTLAEEFVNLGHDVHFVLMEATGPLLAEVPDRAKVHDLAAPRIRSSLSALTGHFRQQAYDAMIANLWPLTVTAPLAARCAGSLARIAIVEHCPLSAQYAGLGWVHRLALRASLRLAAGLSHARIAVSDAVAADLAELTGLPRARFTTIANPIPLRPVSPAERANAEGCWLPGLPRILTVGSLKPEKNQALLIRALARMQGHRPAQLGLLGAGALERDLRKLAEAEGVADRVLFLGHAANPFAWYETADVFALSSDYEGFGNVLVEAMATGLPVVSTDCLGGPRDILDGGRFGRLVATGNADDLAEGLTAMLDKATPDAETLQDRARLYAPPAIATLYLAALGI